MPLHEYECTLCSFRFERIQRFSDPPVEVCPKCQGPVRKLLSAPAIQFKGEGWYASGYTRKPAGGKKESEPGEAKEGKAEEPKGGGKAEDPKGGGKASKPEERP